MQPDILQNAILVLRREGVYLIDYLNDRWELTDYDSPREVFDDYSENAYIVGEYAVSHTVESLAHEKGWSNYSILHVSLDKEEV